MDLLGDLAVVGEDDLVDGLGGLDGVGLVVDPLELLEGTALGLDAGGGRGLVMDVSEKDESGGKTYPKKYQQADSTISQPTKTKMYL